jgi:hypothetical protein
MMILAVSAGCSLIAGVQDGVLAPDGGGGSGSSGGAASSAASSGGGASGTSSTSASSGTSSASSSTGTSSGAAHFHRVQAKEAGNVMVSTASITVTAGTGDLLVVAAFWDATAATIMSVGDSLGNTWQSTSPQVHLKNPCTSSALMQIWYAENVHGGMDTVSVTLTQGGGDLDFFLLEYSGVATVQSLDSQGGQVATTAGNMMSASITTTQPDLVIGLFADTNGDAMTAGSGFQSLGQSTYFSALVEDNLPGGNGTGTPAGAVDVTAQLGASDACWAASAVAFRAAN